MLHVGITMENKRTPYPTRTILITGPKSLETVAQILRYLPIDDKKPIEIVVREHVKKRKNDQNSLYWAGPLKDIAEQAYIDGRQYSAEIWHYFFKAEYLPEDNYIDNYKDLVKNEETYEKWGGTPRGDRILTGSTTDLSVKGFAQFLEQVYAYGANLGVQFRASPSEVLRYG